MVSFMVVFLHCTNPGCRAHSLHAKQLLFLYYTKNVEENEHSFYIEDGSVSGKPHAGTTQPLNSLSLDTYFDPGDAVLL